MIPTIAVWLAGQQELRLVLKDGMRNKWYNCIAMKAARSIRPVRGRQQPS